MTRLHTWITGLALAAALGSTHLAQAQQVQRGPYLQVGTPTSIVVRWRTDVLADSRVLYGTSPDALTAQQYLPVSVKDHEVTLTGLSPNTTYYYAIATGSTVLKGDATYRFTTAPAEGTSKPTRVWVIGDAGTANNNQRLVRDAFLNYTGSRPADVFLMLGDNAYNDGTDAEFQKAVFDIYPSVLRQTPVWPTRGNHERDNSPYYTIFTMPTRGEAGGLASGTEAYYSFDHGDIHFICLDSQGSRSGANGAMATWLKNDLAHNTKPWVIAYWHHPPYSKGSHDSDTETELIQMREVYVPILENGGVDLVLSGHSHSYERSFLIDGHYGRSGTFTSAMKKNGGSGSETGAGGAYNKPAGSNLGRFGAVYAVAGSSGKLTGTPSLNHPAMFISLNKLGSMVLDVDGNKLVASFVRENGAIDDTFTIVKGGTPSADTTPPSAPGPLTAAAASANSVNLSWQAASDNLGVAGYRILRDGVLRASTSGATTLSYADTGLAAATAYHYTVAAFDAAGNVGPASNAAGATTPPAAASLPTVVSFTVVNADTGADIATFTGSGTVSLAATPRINVRANASGAKSVVFTDGSSRRTESSAPYAYKGDSGGAYFKWSPAAGTYTINAQPFSGSGGSGTAGPTATLALTLRTQ